MQHEAIVKRILETLDHKPAGYFSDFDGVLSEIAETPDAAVAHPGVQEALTAIAHHVDVAGVISGRAAGDVASKLDTSELTVIGNHGLEWVEKGKQTDHPAGVAAVEAVARVLDATREQINDDGMVWENKRLSGSIHFRNTVDPVGTELRLLPVVEALAEANGLRVTAGKMVVELRPTAHVSKGTALQQLADEHGLQGLVFWGDDVTDVDGFKTLRELRNAGKHTLSVGVVTVDAHPDIAAYSDVHLASVEEAVEVMGALAAALERKQ